ncbi:MAG: hypothetical protein ACJAU1_001555 [Psychromonas sp.]|jgi:hypothetical protein
MIIITDISEIFMAPDRLSNISSIKYAPADGTE